MLPAAYLAILRAPLSPIIFTAGSFSVRWYGLIIALAILLGYFLARRLQALRPSWAQIDLDALLPWLIIGSILGARLYYVLFRLDYYYYQPWASFKIWEGGLAIHGAVLGGLLMLWLYTKRQRLSLWATTDLLVPALILGQTLGRWGNFFNEEAYGAPTDLPWKLYISPLHRPPTMLDQAYYHPTFLYESLWNGLVFLFLLLLIYRTKKPGIVTACYLIFYSLGRFFVEGLRLDSLMLGPLRAAQVISLLFILGGVVLLWWQARQQQQTKP